MFKNSLQRSLGISAVVSGLMISGAAWSQDAVNLMDREPTRQELIDALLPPEKTRGIKPIGRELEAQEEAVQAVDLAVQFEHNSSLLTDATKKMLSILADALQSDSLSGYSFMIEGHTDASGSDEYNLFLSKRRANSVVDYLTTQHGVDPKQLSPIGKGERELLNVSDPNDGINRRVRIRNMNAG